eukprot:CAMPEP_0182477564 /NCGR_PEP_ID=MMETSP1319-20130603/31082_1 /TAXON_ID=172717 /ORGANISM="Bolidomonas pacifica, Strain RCC208" /LENGTH=174 /DNA_ID=CAMNT_0024678811 /DNA_START=155 /DNA_END=676 /DNA_ORIENTATION=-
MSSLTSNSPPSSPHKTYLLLSPPGYRPLVPFLSAHPPLTPARATGKPVTLRYPPGSVTFIPATYAQGSYPDPVSGRSVAYLEGMRPGRAREEPRDKAIVIGHNVADDVKGQVRELLGGSVEWIGGWEGLWDAVEAGWGPADVSDGVETADTTPPDDGYDDDDVDAGGGRSDAAP